MNCNVRSVTSQGARHFHICSMMLFCNCCSTVLLWYSYGPLHTLNQMVNQMVNHLLSCWRVADNPNPRL